MVTTNQETWYYLHRATPPASFFEAEDLLQTMQILMTGNLQGRLRQVTKNIAGQPLRMVPIPTTSYVLIAATKVYVASAGTYTVRLQATSASPVTMYVRDSSSDTITTYTLTGAANALRTQSASFLANREYTIMFVFANPAMNQTLFINSSYTGTYLPRNKAYVGGSGVTLKQSSSSVVAVGDYKHSARDADFDGWLLCDGREVFRSAYPSLFAVIGTSFGVGNGSTTFNLPDGRGRVPGFVGTGNGLTARAIGQKAGAETHTLIASEMPTHNHTATIDAAGSHTHTATATTDGSHTHAVTDAYYAEHQGGGSFYGSSAGVDTDNNLYTRSTNTESAGAHSHAVTVASAGSHSHAISIANNGGGGAHNIMQPTLFLGNLFICAEV